MEGGNSALREKVAKLIREAAEAKVALDRAEGKIKGVPHYSVIEDAAHELGREVSRLVQQIHMTDLLARQSLSGKCPQCGGRQALRTQHRTVASGDGPVDLIELVGDCTCCRRAFFPSAGKPGI
jgi:DNA polymerase II large subunit